MRRRCLRQAYAAPGLASIAVDGSNLRKANAVPSVCRLPMALKNLAKRGEWPLAKSKPSGLKVGRLHLVMNFCAAAHGSSGQATSVVSAWWLRRKDESTLAGFVFRALEPCWWRAPRSDVIDRGLDPVLSKDGKGLDVIFDPVGIEDMAVNEAVAVRCSFEAAAVRVSR